MSSSTHSTKPKGRGVPIRKGTTLEMIRLCCPDAAQATLIAESFGLPVLDSDGIRDLHEKLIIDAFIGSAHGAGQFYSRAVTEARDATFRRGVAGVTIGVDGQAGKQVLATVVQPGVMLPAQPSYPERLAIIIMMSIRLETSADLTSLPGQFAAFERALDRQVSPIFFGILTPPVGLPGVGLEIELAHARLQSFRQHR